MFSFLFLGFSAGFSGFSAGFYKTCVYIYKTIRIVECVCVCVCTYVFPKNKSVRLSALATHWQRMSNIYHIIIKKFRNLLF